jgi:solute carrier family 8 (sodium/calcium exchanger)
MAHSRNYSKHSNKYLILLGLLCVILPQATAQENTTEKPYDRCSAEELAKSRVCEKGIVIPVWEPAETENLTGFEIAGRAIVYLIALVYLFLGVAIVADKFMASIEVITSKEKTVTYTRSDGERVETTVRIWNETISNLTLMALGSSAPEIMLSVIEVVGKGFRAGDLGPSTIVGSASFNLFIIIAICMYVIPDDEVRKIKHLRVFFMTATWSILAYIWLYVILAVTSPGVVEIWEGVLTFVFFPILVALAYIADQRLLVYKYMYKRYRRKKGIIVETEGKSPYDEDYNMDDMGDAENAGISGSGYVGGDDADGRLQMVELMRELRKKHPEADMNELAKMATAQALNQQQKSRAFYRVHATRMMTGSGNVMKKNALGVDKPDMAASMMNLAVDDEHIAKVFFDPPDYKVMENCGAAELQISRRGGDINTTVYVDYRTIDGSANAGSDYTAVEDTAVFKPGETLCTIQVPILDDDIFEEDEFFKVELSNVRFGGQDGATDFSKIRLESPAVATVVILDDDHAGVFQFKESQITVAEGVGVLKVEVSRNSGARGTVAVPYKTVPGSAKGGGQDYLDSVGVLEFNDDETSKFVKITIVDDEEYEKNKMFSVELGVPRLIMDGQSADSGTDVGSDSGINGKEDEMLISNLTEEEEEARRIAELGKPRLGETTVTEIVIEESYEFKNTVDKLIKKANLAVVVGTSSWREQFIEALEVSAGDDDDDEDAGDEEAEPTCCDYVMHFLTVFWKLLFACVPPTDIAGGWACFTVSIMGIGALTAVIGDVASHFGCVVNLNDEVTAVTLVAMGTSVPDTFASKVAACGDPYADASVGNVTGSNAVNVFLGIGIAWTMAAIYWACVGKTPEEQQFKVKVGNLAFSVTIFSIFALFAIFVLMMRRRASSIQAELGGPRPWKIMSSLIFVALWVVYIALAALDSYCVIKTF